MQRLRWLFVLPLLFLSAIAAAQPASVTGTVTYRERIAMPAGAVVEITIEDVSRVDAPATAVSAMRIDDPGQVPIRFDLGYDPMLINPRSRYAVRARLFVGDRLMFATTANALVLTQGHGTTANLIMQRVPAPPAKAAAPAEAATMASKAPAPPTVPRTPPPPDPFTGLPASFTGTLPCADCPGIRYQLNLFADDSFFLRRSYLGRGATVDIIGTWVISSDRRIVGLHDGKGDALEYFAIRDARTLRALDRDLNELPASLPSTVTRDARFAPIDVRLAMRGTYRYMADAGLFTECSTGQQWPVAMEADNRALESAYLQAKHAAGAPILAALDGQVVARPHPDRATNVPTLLVHRFDKLEPAATCEMRYTSAPFESTTWQLTHLGADAVPAATNPRNQPSIAFEPDSTHFSGAGGCNRFAGSYETTGEALTMTAIGTMMACPTGGDIESRFMSAIKNTTRFRAIGRTLELFDAKGTRLARFEAR